MKTRTASALAATFCPLSSVAGDEALATFKVLSPQVGLQLAQASGQDAPSSQSEVDFYPRHLGLLRRVAPRLFAFRGRHARASTLGAVQPPGFQDHGSD